MRVFLAGATGAVGRYLVPGLVARGHAVTALTRSPAKAAGLRELGAEPVVGDALVRARIVEAVERAEPDVVVHQLTALASLRSLRKFEREFALTNRLRTEGTDNLLEGARRAGARRFVAQSYGAAIYERAGSAVKTESDPLDAEPPAPQRTTFRAIRHLEEAVTGAAGLAGIALRYGLFYGPGTSLGPDGSMTELVRRRRVPIIGDGAGVWSFVHVHDAATAALAAIETGAPGIYNVADDDPAPVAVWLPELARLLGARPPQRVPVWIGRLAAGDAGVSTMTRIRGLSSAKAKRELGWEPRYRSWRDGFRELAAGSHRRFTPASGVPA